MSLGRAVAAGSLVEVVGRRGCACIWKERHWYMTDGWLCTRGARQSGIELSDFALGGFQRIEISAGGWRVCPQKCLR